MQLLLTVRGQGDRCIEASEAATVGDITDALGFGVQQTLQTTRDKTPIRRSTLVAVADLRCGDFVEPCSESAPLDSTRGNPPVDTSPACLEVVNGPEKGAVYHLRFGRNSVGRGPENDIVLANPQASNKHAAINVGDIVQVVDLASTNGVFIGGQAINAPAVLRTGSRMRIGEQVFEFSQTKTTPGLVDMSGNAVDFNRPPRILRRERDVEVELPLPPSEPPKQRLPRAAAVVPLLMGVFLYLITRNVATIAFVLLSPMMIFGNYWESKRSGRLDHKQRLEEFHEDLDKATVKLNRAVEDEVRERYESSPAPSELHYQIDQLTARLWEREPQDEDFLCLRVGTAPQESPVSAKLQKGGARELAQMLEEIPPRYEMLPAVPVLVPLREHGVLGVSGLGDFSDQLATSIMSQIAVLHSPGEVAIAAMIGEANIDKWEFLKWLPHCRSPLSPLKGPHLAVSANDHQRLLAELFEIIQTRLDGQSAMAGEPHIVVLIDDSTSLPRNRFTQLLENGRHAGVSIVWVAETERQLPKACRAIVNVPPGGASVEIGMVEERAQIRQASFEPMSTREAGRVARKLSPVVDVSSRAAGSSETPSRVSLVNLVGGPQIMARPEVVLERWKASSANASLGGPIGMSGADTFSIDLRHDGPHGLVAGTTGAGKSELLQSMLVGLAVTHAPQKVTFLLVDYKGGSAFKDVVKLPHTVGLVTDLSPALVQRALSSLRAELHLREHLLNEANAKDLMQMEEQRHPKTPPSLIIVVDEFAALAREVPEFVEGVVDIAQRGRSLGLHLMLATQRPAGVITDNIRANTNLRIALRVNDKNDSSDVLDDPAAASIDRSLPGRGLARLGPSELITFQSGYVGGVTDPTAKASVEVARFEVDGMVPIQGEAVKTPMSADDADTDLERMVRTLNDAYHSTGEPPPRRPWLDPLSEGYDLFRLPRTEVPGQLVLGVADRPENQEQEVISVDLDRNGSMLIFGAGGSGRTVTLRTLTLAAAEESDRVNIQIYGLDFAGRGLEMLDALPQVGDVISGEDYERVTRLLQLAQRWISERAKLYGEARAATLEEYRRNTGASDPRIVILLDGYENFHAAYERIDRGKWFELLPRLVADGRAVGVNFLITANRRNSLPMSISSTVQQNLVLRLANPDDYATLGVDPKLFDGDEPPGRGTIGGSMIHVAIGGQSLDTQGQSEWIRAFAERFNGVEKAPKVGILPDRVELKNVRSSGGDGVAIGLTDELQPFHLPTDQAILITAPRRGGKTTAIRTISQALVAKSIRPIVLSGRRPVEGLSRHARTATGPSEAAALLKATTFKPGDVLLVDELEELLGSEADADLADVLATDGVGVIAAAEVSQVRRGFSETLGLLKRNRQTLILMPDLDLDGDLANGPLPRNQRQFPPGRGYFSDAGNLTICHIATS